jgi:hypothetical protein
MYNLALSLQKLIGDAAENESAYNEAVQNLVKSEPSAQQPPLHPSNLEGKEANPRSNHPLNPPPAELNLTD